MKKFTIKVPYRETVYGWTTYLVEADSREEAREILLKDDHLYYYDEEADHSDHYTQFWDDAEWEEKK
jgi:hypothetical protein